MKAVIIPGNGAGDVTGCLWYSWVADKLTQSGIPTELRNMPDPVTAREAVWLPFMEEELGCDETTIIIGHSSGAEAAMRYAEGHKVLAIVLVSACVTDLGDANERQSGYYSRPWLFDRMVENTEWTMQYASTDDPFIPISEMHTVRDGLSAGGKHSYNEFADRGHFQDLTFKGLVRAVLAKAGAEKEG